MANTIKWLDGIPKKEHKEHSELTSQGSALLQHPAGEPQRKTAIQVINEMVQARLTQPEVDGLDDYGIRSTSKIPSTEFKLLQDHGLKVINVKISNLRFHPRVEETIANRWLDSWLDSMKEESAQIERRRNVLKAAGHERAICHYAEELSTNLLTKRPMGAQDVLKTLIAQTRDVLLKNEQLHERFTEHQEVFEQIIKWLDANEK